MTPRHASRYRSPRALRYHDLASEASWELLGEPELLAAIDAEPLRYLADHLDGADRRDDRAAVYLRPRCGGPVVTVLDDMPTRVDAFEVAELLRLLLSSTAAVGCEALGVVLHEVEPEPSSTAGQWVTALETVAEEHGCLPLGVAVRYADGVLAMAQPWDAAALE